MIMVLMNFLLENYILFVPTFVPFVEITVVI